MGGFPGAGVREDIYARPISLAGPPSSGVGIGAITFAHGHLKALILDDFIW